MKYNCLVADDEPIARQIIEKYISDVPDLHLSASCKNAFEVMQVLADQQIDLLFLDINMPKLSGISLLKTLKNYPNVIITTAYSEYALEGYDLEVVDYLMKPISFERFLKGVNKVRNRKSLKPQSTPRQVNKTIDSIFIKSDKKQIQISFDDIVYVAAFGNYIKIFTAEMILSPSTLTEIIHKLPDSDFVRIHKSHLVNRHKIKQIEGNKVTLVTGDTLPIGQSFRKNVVALFKD